MRIQYTKTLDKEKTECVVFFNKDMWIYVKERCNTYNGYYLSNEYRKFSGCGYANHNYIETWAKSVEYYSITNETYIFLKNVIEKVINDIGNRRKYLDRIRDSFVEL